MLNESKTLQAGLYYVYNFPWNNGTTKISSSSDLGASLKYLAFDKKLTITLSAEDILKSNIQTYTNQIKKQNITESYRQYYDTRSIRLSLSYKFGNSKISVRQHQGGNAEEKGRAN